MSEPNESTNASLSVSAIIAARDKQPYIQIIIEDGNNAQLTMSQARQVAADILTICARAEADAMIYKFFDAADYPRGAAVEVMKQFRDYRAELDDETVEHSHREPVPGE